MAQPTFLVKTHLVFIVWRMSYELSVLLFQPNGVGLPGKKLGLICGSVSKDEPGENFKGNYKI